MITESKVTRKDCFHKKEIDMGGCLLQRPYFNHRRREFRYYWNSKSVISKGPNGGNGPKSVVMAELNLKVFIMSVFSRYQQSLFRYSFSIAALSSTLNLDFGILTTEL